MPDLPTLNVTPAQADRLLAAFGSVAKYREWLRKALQDYVIVSERERLRAGLEEDIVASDRRVEQDLKGI